MNAPYIFPYNTLLEWDDINSIILSGTADSSTITVSAVENDVVSEIYFNATSNEWSYTTDITGYSNNFVIISENSIGETASSVAFIDVDGPIIINTLPTYNILNPSLEGRTNPIAIQLEAGPNSLTFSPSGFAREDIAQEFVYNNFIFNSPEQSFYFIGVDVEGKSSDPREITLNYEMNDPFIFTKLTDPYDSRTVSLAGSADPDISGFVYTPSGGQFTSAQIDNSSGGYTLWSYNFVLMEQSEEFSLKTIDVFGNESSEQIIQINYGIEKPIIIFPGNVKSISDNKASTGSTSLIFYTLDGDFRNEGVIVSDIALALSGKNIGDYRKITYVGDDFLETESFAYPWEIGDRLNIYPREDRPVLYTDQNSITLSGKCNKNVAKIRYTTEELKPLKLYAKNLQNYTISILNNNLALNINGKFEFIILPSGILSAQDIADTINNKFRNYFNYDVAFVENNRVYLEALHLRVYPGTANEIIGFIEGEINFYLEIEVSDIITFKNLETDERDCTVDIVEGDLLFCMNIDGIFIRFTVNTNQEYTKNELINKINELAGREVAISIENRIVFYAFNNLWVGDPLPDINLKEQLSGNADFNNEVNLSSDIGRDPNSIETGISIDGNMFEGIEGIEENNVFVDVDDNGELVYGYLGHAGVGAGVWGIDLDIVQPSNNIKIYALNEFYELSDPVSLNVEYVIKSPTVNDFPESTTEEVIDLSGNYNSSGLGVTLNGVSVDLAKEGYWSHQLDNLSLGSNNLIISSIDRFGRNSESTSISITRTDPNNVAFPSQPGGIPLRWLSLTTPSFAPSDVSNAANAIDNIFSPIISVLDLVSGLLNIAKSLIIDIILGPIAALRLAVQLLIDNITGLLDKLVNGAGIYTLSTLPAYSDIRPGQFIDSLNYIKGSFPDFFNKIESSFNDNLDSNRPQLSPTSTVGGYVLAIGDGAGVDNFLKALNSLTKLYNKQKNDYGLEPVNNLKVEGQNRRNVLTWTAPDGESNVFPYDYIILREEVSGGKLKTRNVKSQVSAKGKGYQYFKENYYDPETGESEGEYEVIGKLTNYRVMKEFKFIDGNATSQELNNSKGVDKYVQGTVNFFEATRDYVMVVTGSTGKPIENGKTYYYKVVPAIGVTDLNWESFTKATTKGGSIEVISTASYTHLEKRTEYLYDQIEKTKIGYYKLSGSIYDKDTGLFADNVNSISIKVDGAIVRPAKIFSEKGLIILNNPPRDSLEVIYWGKNIQSTTRASIVSLNQGPFIFKEDNNVLGIQVGRGSNITETIGLSPITRTQNITLTRFKSGESEITMSADEVASVIRSQTSGLRVFVDHMNRIVLEEDQNPNIYIGSYLEVKITNTVLGFINIADLPRYQIPVKEVYTFAGMGTELDYSHTKSEAGPLSGTPPDWKSMRVSDLFPVVDDLLRYINNAFDQIAKGLESATSSLIDFIDLLKNKIDALSEMLKEVQVLIQRLLEVLTIQGGFYLLEIPPRSGGEDYFKSALRNSIGYPLDAEYAGGIVFLYTDGGTGVALDWILGSIK